MEFYDHVSVGTLFILYTSVEWNAGSNCSRLLDLLSLSGVDRRDCPGFAILNLSKLCISIVFFHITTPHSIHLRSQSGPSSIPQCPFPSTFIV